MISFIIPTRNEEKVIEKLLSCLADYRGAKEIIVTDGASTDQTLTIARKYTDKVIEYHGSTRQNIAQGKNTGAQLAVGKTLLFLDSDVYIPDINNFMAEVLTIFESDKNILGLTVSYKVFKEMATWADRLIFSIVDLNFLIFNNFFHLGASGGEFQLVRAEAFKKIGGFDEGLALAEDNDLFWRLNKIGRTYCAHHLVIYHTGRRAHKIGWPKLLWQWATGGLSAYFFKKSAVAEWTEIR